MAEEEVPNHKLQPVVLIIPKRLECGKCRALAVFVALDLIEEDAENDHTLFDYGAYCQDCWHKQVVESEEEAEC